MKYLVMECHEDYAVLLDEEAGFVKAKNTGLTVGETIENPELLKTEASRRNIIMKAAYGLAAAAACVTVAFGVNYYNEYMTPYSNIRLSINPDVEMTLNHHGQVLSLEGLNEDGKELIDGYNPKKQDKLAVADDLIERAINMGYLDDDAIIIFDIDTPDKDLLTQYGIELRHEAEIYTCEFANVNIIIIDRNDEAQHSETTSEYSDTDYEPIIIPVPQQTEAAAIRPQTKPSGTIPIDSDSVYEEKYDGDSIYDSNYGDSRYNEITTQATTKPAIVNPPVQSSGSDIGDYTQENDSGYDMSDYEADSDYGDESDYD